MLVRVLLVLLTGIPVCWGAEGGSYSAYYEPDGNVENADFYDSYNDEIRQPPERTTVKESLTRMKRNDLEDMRTLNPEEIVDVKGVLNNILQGKKPESPKEPPSKQYTDTYEYVENSNNLETDDRRTASGSDFKKWLPTLAGQKLSPSTDNQGVVETTTPVTEKYWSLMYQPETSTFSKNDIIEEVRRMMPSNIVVPKRSSGDQQYWTPTPEARTLTTTENTEETVHPMDIYPQETSTFSNSHMQGEVNKLLAVQDWKPTSQVTDLYPQETTTYSNSDMRAEVNKLVQHWSPGAKQETPYDESVMRAEMRTLVQHWSPGAKQETTYNDDAMRAKVRSLVQHWSPGAPSSAPSRSHTNKVEDWSPSSSEAPISEKHQHISGMQSETGTTGPENPTSDQHRDPSQTVQHFGASGDNQQWNPDDIVRQRDPYANMQSPEPSSNVQTVTRTPEAQKDKDMEVTTSTGVEEKSEAAVQLWSDTTAAQQWTTMTGTDEDTDSTLDTENSTDIMLVGRQAKIQPPKVVPKIVPVPALTLPPTTPTTTTQRMDVDAIMAIISNLTYDYEWNLTEMFNKSIIEHGVPTCPWKGGGKWGPGGAWTAMENLTTLPPYDFENSSVVSKCFVCGLTTPEIPRNAYCSDAFAGDFLPLMPIDARSRSMIANYRKYCRYVDVQNYVENPEEPRSIYGRFTGGCAVRWTDITGVYTQRTCRSRYRPLLGKHFASKRMAKLELALVNVDNGCIISPMATLLPVSRGISLYARFHACVCSSNWCNRAVLEETSRSTVLTILLAHWLAFHS